MAPGTAKGSEKSVKEHQATAADHLVAPESSGREEIILYGSRTCPFSQRARIALDSKGLEYDYRETDPDSKPAELLRHNPRGTVPTLVHNGENRRPLRSAVSCMQKGLVVCL